VDIVCVLMSIGGPGVTILKAAVPVTGGAFSDVVTLPNFIGNCRMRAVPDGVDTTADYLGSYAGPILYMWGFLPLMDGSTAIGYDASAARGDAIGFVGDAASCGPAVLATIAPPTMEVRGLGSQACTLQLTSGNLTDTGTSTASTIKVSGHNAYLPGTVSSYLRDTLALALPQPALTTSMSRASNGDLTLTESAPLQRCSGSDLYPPTSGSCPSLTGTGVTFQRVTSIIRGSHQVRLRDTFASTDAQAHTVSVQYVSEAQSVEAGSPGYLFPAASQFATAAPDQVVTSLGTKAASLLLRSDIHAVEGEQFADTRALTWSRAPTKVQFSHAPPTRTFAMPYALSVPANGSARLGFAVSDANLTSQVKPLAAVAKGEMMNTPSITSPANHAHLHGHAITVKGSVTRGANGLPVTVAVNGHSATLTVVSAAAATYKATFRLPFGTHTITAKATDIAHNTRARSISIHNSA
jgi:hypothetical protein